MAVLVGRRRRGTLLCVAAMPLVGLLAACGSDHSGKPRVPSPPTAAAPCDASSCRPQQTVRLAGGDELRLWLSTDKQDYRSRPVVELVSDGASVQSWASPQGDGWNGRLTCLTGTAGADDSAAAAGPGDAPPNCVLTGSAGMHASIAELLLVRDGRLIHPAGAEVVADSPGVRAADLDHDGFLDVIATTNDYTPNYAQGHNYWQTFRYAGGGFELTGCARQPGPVPSQLLTGTCPPGR